MFKKVFLILLPWRWERFLFMRRNSQPRKCRSLFLGGRGSHRPDLSSPGGHNREISRKAVVVVNRRGEPGRWDTPRECRPGPMATSSRPQSPP